MIAPLLLFPALVGPALAAQMTTAKSYTGWDCCKPICATGGSQSRGTAKVCDKNNNPLELSAGIRANSGCLGGNAFLCDNFQPVPVADDLSYGFAIQVSDTQVGDNPNCCKCYEVQWLSGGAQNKRMIVQILTPGGSGGDVKKNDLIFLVPGGGLGPLNTGCPAQYGNSFSWGDRNGGFKNRQGCDGLPPNLQGGCYWRFNWARGELNGWDIQYQPVACPSRLTSISGCEAKP